MPSRRVLRKTKVVATIGPASDSVDMIKQLIQAGMNVARLNFSHGTHAQHLETLERIRKASAELSANTAVMLDTRGVEIRTGSVDQGRVELLDGETFILYSQDRPGTREGVSVSYENLPREVRLGSAILLDDGRIELRIQSLADDEIRCKVVRGGELGSHKGLNVPDATLTQEAMGPDDHGELLFAVKNDLDYVAASFVRRASDIVAMREFIESLGGRIPLIAKIENREGVANLDEIVAVADGTMVARGDLGVELPVQEVPLIQKRIIRTTVLAGKPVITATQMLDSMERSARPTRAEASDVANAILDGTSAVCRRAPAYPKPDAPTPGCSARSSPCGGSSIPATTARWPPHRLRSNRIRGSRGARGRVSPSAACRRKCRERAGPFRLPLYR